MTRRTFTSILLLALTLPIREVWQIWKHSGQEVNWWLALDYPLSIQWWMKFLGEHIASVLTAIVLFRVTFKIQALRMAAVVFLIYSLIDLVMFFICFNRAEYALIYTTVGVVSLVVIYWRTISKKIFSFHPQAKHS